MKVHIARDSKPQVWVGYIGAVIKDHSKHESHYLSLFAMIVVSFASMYVLMYAMADRLGHVYNNVNQIYMAGLMAAPMLIVELLVMKKMYPNLMINLALGLGSVATALTFWALIRTQTGVGDQQFLRSMIPHHAGAILMCEEASLSDATIRDLCARIVESQNSEISQMQKLLDSE